MGNLTRDVDLKTTNNGFQIGNTGIALNRKWRDKSGQMKEEVCFVDLQLWGKQAESAQQYTKKGSPVFVEGHLKLDQWVDKNTGAKRSKTYVVVDRMQFLPSSRPQPGAQQAAKPYVRQPEAHPEPQDDPPDVNDPPFGAHAAPQGQFDTLDDLPPPAEEPTGDTPF